ILAEAMSRKLTIDSIDEFQAHPGAGVTARTAGENGVTIVVGTRRLLEEQKIAIPPAALALLERTDLARQTALLVALGDIVVGVIGAQDRLRPEAPGVIADLKDLGIKDIALLTGDRLAVARTIASGVGITEVHAELLPDQKADFIFAWRV